MTSKTTNTILILMLAGIVLGAWFGYYFPAMMLSIGVIGRLFVSALQLVVAPLIVAGIIVGIASLGNARQLGRPLVTTLVFFVGTTVIAVGIGLVLAMLLQPGWGVSTVGATLPEEMTALKSIGITDVLLSFIPTSLPQAVIEGQYLGIIICSLFFGGALAAVGQQAKAVVDFFRGIYEIILKLVYVILYVAPIGLFSVVGLIVAMKSGSLVELSGNLFYFALALGAGLLIHGVIVLPVILKFFGHRSPVRYFGNMVPALSTAFASASSSVAFPVTYAGVVDRNKVDSRAGSLALPLGMVMNLNGTAMYVAIAALFVAQAFGMNLSVVQIVMMAVVCILVSLGAASIPFAGLFLLVFVLRTGGFPEEAYAGIGLIIGVDWVFDRFRAVVNVWSDSVAAAVVERQFQRETDRKERITRVRPHKAATAERRARVPANTRVRESRQVSEAQRPHRDESTSRGDRNRRDRTMRAPASKKGPRQRREETRHRPHDETARHRPAQKPEPEKATASLSVPTTPEPDVASVPVRSKLSASSGGSRLTGEEVTASPSISGAEGKQEMAPVKTGEASSVEYGRLKSRRGRVVKNGQAPEHRNDPETPNVQEEFPLDDISFGRHKKKRQR